MALWRSTFAASHKLDVYETADDHARVLRLTSSPALIRGRVAQRGVYRTEAAASRNALEGRWLSTVFHGSVRSMPPGPRDVGCLPAQSPA